jgi:hypothetical protein
VTLDSVGWLAGFKVAVSEASLDPATNVVSLGVLLTNTSQVDRSFSAVSEEVSLDPGDQTGRVPLSSVTPSGAVVAGTAARSTLVFRARPGVSLDQAVLVLGKGVNHYWLVPLRRGATASGESPLTLAPPGRLTTATHTYFDVTSAQVLPWSCQGVAPRTAFIPSARTSSVLALAGTAGADAVPRQGTSIDAISVTAPNGTTAAVLTLPLQTWSSHQSTANELLCVPIPAGLPGRYVLRITDYYRKTATATIEVP